VEEQAARTELVSICPPAENPTLTESEIISMVMHAKRPDGFGNPPDNYIPWTANTLVRVGAFVVPTIRNGSVYRATVAGTTGATEPVWPTSVGGAVSDASASWERSSAAPWVPTWDLAAGAVYGWRIKAGRAASGYQFSDGGASFARNQILEHCLKMIQLYSGSGVGSLRIRGRLATHSPWARVVGNGGG
jgi:hypothetical protein